MSGYFFSVFNRYCYRIWAYWMLLLVAAIGSVIGIFEMVELARRTMGDKSISVADMLLLISLKLADHIQSLLLFIALLAVMLTVWRLDQKKELTAARACGFSLRKIAAGLAGACVAAGIFNIAVWQPVNAALFQQRAFLEMKLLKKHDQAMAVESSGLWFREKNTVIHALYVTKDFIFHNLSIYEFDDDMQLLKRYDAARARLQDNAWHMEEAAVRGADGPTVFYRNVTCPAGIDIAVIQDYYKLPQHLPWWKVTDFIGVLQNAGLSDMPYKLYWYAQGASLLMFAAAAFLGVFLASLPIRNRNTGVILSLGFAMNLLLHFALNLAHAAATVGMLRPLPAAFGIPVAALLSGVFALLAAERGKRFHRRIINPGV